nr:cyclic AMP-responsive element-binding protein-like [Aedes albopictus]
MTLRNENPVFRINRKNLRKIVFETKRNKKRSSHYYYLPPTLSQTANAHGDGSGLHALAATGGGVVQYTQAQDGQIYVPLIGGNVQLEDQSRKREMRLQKNREAARECRRKKKEYIKCLENRVAVLENQNKALIEELKSLKELYCQQKND